METSKNSGTMRILFKIIYGCLWRFIPLPTLLMAYRQNTITSYYKMLTRRQYLAIMNSDSAVYFPSFRRSREDIYFYRPPNEEGRESKLAMIVPVVAYVEQK